MKESGIVSAIGSYLGMLENMGRLLFIRNNTGAFPISGYQDWRGRVRRRFIRFGKAGSSDFIVFLPDRRTVFLEVKSPTGKQSETQKEFQTRAEKLGYEYYLVRAVDEVEKIIGGER